MKIPLKKYGLELTSAKQVQIFLCGLIGGVMLMFLIQSTNVLVGSVSISWPTIPSSTDVAMLKLFGEGLRIVGLRLLTTDVVAVVEEMLFRSWLPEEFVADLGFNQGIILRGLAFSLCQCLKAAAKNYGHPEWGNTGPTDAGEYNSWPEETKFFKRQCGGWNDE